MGLQGATSWIEFVSEVSTIGKIYDGSISSAGRTDAHNAKVGGVVNSRHRWERNAAAIDMVFDSLAGLEEAAKAAVKCGYKVLQYPDKLQLHIASTADWVPS